MKIAYTTLDNIEPIFRDDKEWFHLKKLTKELKPGDRIKIGSRMFYVHRCDKMLTDEGYGVLCVESHYGAYKSAR